MLLTIAAIYWDQNAAFTTVYVILKTAMQVFLLGWCGFLIITHFYESGSSSSRKVIKIRRKSDHFTTLAFYGIIISIAQFALVYHYGDLFGFDSILIATFLLYFLSQVAQNSHPRVMISNTHVGLSDFKSTLIPWDQVQKVRLEPKLLVIKTNKSENSMTLSGMEDISVQELEQELAAEVLDGSIASESTSNTLSQIFAQYAVDRGFDLESTS